MRLLEQSGRSGATRPRPSRAPTAAKAVFFFVCLLLAASCGGGSQPAQAPSQSTEVDLSSSEPAYVAESQDETALPVAEERSAPHERSELVPIDSDDAVWGDAAAPVTVVAFLDYQCPFCARVQPTLAEIREVYGPSKVRMVFKHNPLPFHKRALPAAEVAQAVLALGGEGAFFEFSARAYENYRTLTDDELLSWGVAAGVSRRALESKRFDQLIQAQVRNDMDVAKRAGITGTPGFRINGVKLSGAQPFTRFQEIIDAELAAADKLLEQGVPQGAIYARRVATNFQPDNDDTWPSAQKAPSRRPPPKKKPEDKTAYKVPVGKSPTLGPTDALVTIVEFSDFQCPFCKRAKATLDRVRKEYGDDVRLVYKHNALPFHPRAMPAAMLAIEAHKQRGNRGFWDAHDRLFDAHPKLEDDDLFAIAKDMKLAMWGVKRAVSKSTHKKIVDQDMDLASDQNARGTPHFFINGRRLTGARPFAEFKRVIDEEIVKAKQLMADKGISRAKVYATIMKTAKGPPPPEKKLGVPKPTKKNPSRGVAWAPVTIQIFSEFQCPFCARARPTIEQITKEFKGRVRIVWRNLPLAFHKDARLAAVAAMEAHAQGGNKKFWKMYDLLFDNQKKPDGLKRAALIGYAQKLKLDIGRFEAALDDGRHDAVIDADLAVAKKAGIRGTPGFMINDFFVSGAQPIGKFRKVIKHALKHRKKKP